jgi:1-acyl-sn-glycerol-3-phosphate acyltransferase
MTRFFERYAVRKIRRNFHAVHVDPSSMPTIKKIQDQTDPTILLMNHPCWWDPITIMFISGFYLRERTHSAPMEISQLRRFRIFRKVGLFGIDPDHPETPAKMDAYIQEVFRLNPKALLWITPQGQFTDVRDKIRLRPGAAALAARNPQASVFCVGMEYNFWQDQKPELFLRFQPCLTEDLSTSGWYRAMRRAMQENLDALSKLVVRRDASAFIQPLGQSRAKTSLLYDWLLRLRGQHGDIKIRQNSKEGSNK